LEIKPKPFSKLNHLTRPVGIGISLQILVFV
jgi:hypothetical protein